MMADHWKSIANLLGAPGVDEPEEATHVETQAELTPRSQPVSGQHTARKSTPTASSARPAKSPEARQESSRERGGFGQGIVSSGQGADADPSAGAGANDSGHAVEQGFAHQPSAPELSGETPASGFHFDPDKPIPDEALSFKSLRPKPERSKTSPQLEPPADKSELASITTSTPSPPAARSFSEPSPPQAAEARREAPRMRDRTEPSTPAVAPPPEAPTRRKSSWESLANMFNIKVDRSKPAEVSQEVDRPTPEPVQPRGSRPADEADTDDEQPFAIFSEQRPSRSNPALDAMFGDAPSPSKSSHDDWGKPRVIDDLGWDNDDRKRSSHRDDSAVSGAVSGAAQAESPQERASSEPASEGDDEDAPRRGRRRRRGRRGRSDSTSSATDSSPAAESSRSWGGLDGDTDGDNTGRNTVDESDHGLHDDPWDEPESFELIQPGDVGQPDRDSSDDSDEPSADGEVLRRSSRRRRRGRSSGERDVDETASAAPATRDSRRERPTPSSRGNSEDRDGSVSFRADSEGEVRDDAADQSEAPRAGRGPRRAESDDREERSSRSPRGRRSGSSDRENSPRRGAAADSSSRSTASRRSTRPSDEQGPIEDSFDDASLGPDGDEDEVLGGDGQHRSIPTWADSIASLIQTNTENRKRGDNRGAPRGRPRGRR